MHSDDFRPAHYMDNWTIGAFSDSIEEKVKKLNLYRIPELPKDTFIKPRKRAEYWPPHMVPSSQLQKVQQDSTGNNNNSITSSTTNKTENSVDYNSVAIVNNDNMTDTKNKNNHSMNSSSNENINDFILVELVI